VLEELPKMPSTVANCWGKYYCSQKCQKETYLSELALKHECKSETKQTLLVGSTRILEQKVDPSFHIWRFKSRCEYYAGSQFYHDMQGMQLQADVLPFFPRLSPLRALAAYSSLLTLSQRG